METTRTVKIILAAVALSQVELAERTGMTTSYIRQVLNGYAPLTDRHCELIGAEVGRRLMELRRMAPQELRDDPEKAE